MVVWITFKGRGKLAWVDFPVCGFAVLSSGSGVMGGGVVFMGGAVFSPRLRRLCEVCVGVGIWGGM